MSNTANAPRQPTVERRTILLVEDNPDDVKLTVRAFKKSRVANTVDVACDGVEALEYLSCTGKFEGREPVLPECILLDLKLPRLDGLEVLRRVREDESTKLIPVIILTTSNEEKDRLASYNLGANSFVRKPVKFSEFVEAVQQLGLYWLVLNRPPYTRTQP